VPSFYAGRRAAQSYRTLPKFTRRSWPADRGQTANPSRRRGQRSGHRDQYTNDFPASGDFDAAESAKSPPRGVAATTLQGEHAQVRSAVLLEQEGTARHVHFQSGADAARMKDGGRKSRQGEQTLAAHLRLRAGLGCKANVVYLFEYNSAGPLRGGWGGGGGGGGGWDDRAETKISLDSARPGGWKISRLSPKPRILEGKIKLMARDNRFTLEKRYSEEPRRHRRGRTRRTGE